jgi:hypothetical protein
MRHQWLAAIKNSSLKTDQPMQFGHEVAHENRHNAHNYEMGIPVFRHDGFGGDGCG